ncbi:hypothetical protein Sjap_019672 [Stephania japonica]|uniref:VWFA domain-containing protein n=1 Tax=Stephania japonica TaxID=461633 RepID=A0AAP0HUY0_9MAGN
MAEEEFVKSVEDGLKLAKRIYFGKDRSVLPPKVLTAMERSQSYRRLHLMPTAPMVYAVISDPTIVDNPDLPSYQPHVHGRIDPPALIPLQMNGIEMAVDCCLDTAFVTVTGSWRVHCVMASRSCDCRLAVPVGEQGSILGVEVDVARRSYSSQLIAMEETPEMEKSAKPENGGFLTPQIFTLLIPQVDGGSNITVKVSWSQKLSYDAGQFSLAVQFSFPDFVTPSGKKIVKREKVQLNVNSGTGTEVLCREASHPFKEIRRLVGQLGFLYEADVITWSENDLKFSYAVSSNDISGGVFLQAPSPLDFDQREIFCFYLFAGSEQRRKVFRKEVIFLVDTSESMKGKPLESVKNTLFASLSMLNPEDAFGIIAFNGETNSLSSSLVLATKENIDNATDWINSNFIAGGLTDILKPLNQAIEMLSNSSGSVPIIFVITDGAVEDERHICEVVRSHLKNRGSFAPRISTFGIGTYCNQYFLQMLAMIGRGYCDAAYDVGSIETRMQRLFTAASSVVLADIIIDSFEQLDTVEVFPSQIPNLSSGCLLTVSGRCQGSLPGSIKARGTLADRSTLTVDLKVQKSKDLPLDKVVAKRQIDVLTAQAWFSHSKELEEKVVKMSIQMGIPSEYTRMIIVQTDKIKPSAQSASALQDLSKANLQKLVSSKERLVFLLKSLGIGFGNLAATIDGTPPGFGEYEPSEAAGEAFVKAASNCCSRLADCCCCMCCIQACSKLNNQCATALIQLCAALSCLACLSCCSDD